ncbi:MAG: OB-fold domain-containing protein [Gammaproteobacteria bacterium]|nr:OB-fold domain-containing protein [Gammaproteobacteria bacterium]
MAVDPITVVAFNASFRLEDNGEGMKQGVDPDDLTRPFWEAANLDRLVIQNCTRCDRLQHPPARTCHQCGSDGALAWKEMSGRGRIYNYGVVHDCPIRLLQEDQPFNVAVIMLNDDPGIQMYSHLPGTPVDDIPIGADVEVVFEATANGQKVPEWRVVAGER